jgi:hypothetical protein
MYDKIQNLQKSWTPIERKIIEIQIDGNPSQIITRIKFSIQLVVVSITHHAQGLTLDHLTFDPSGVTKHGLTYTILFRTKCKDNLYLLSPHYRKMQLFYKVQLD